MRTYVISGRQNSHWSLFLIADRANFATPNAAVFSRTSYSGSPRLGRPYYNFPGIMR